MIVSSSSVPVIVLVDCCRYRTLHVLSPVVWSVTGHMTWVGGWVVFVIFGRDTVRVVCRPVRSPAFRWRVAGVTPGSAAGNANRSRVDASDGAVFGQEPRQAAAVADQRASAVTSHSRVIHMLAFTTQCHRWTRTKAVLSVNLLRCVYTEGTTPIKVLMPPPYPTSLHQRLHHSRQTTLASTATDRSLVSWGS